MKTNNTDTISNYNYESIYYVTAYYDNNDKIDEGISFKVDLQKIKEKIDNYLLNKKGN